MTLFDQCVEAAMDAEITLGPADAKAITRAVLETIRDHTPSPRTVDEMVRVLGEAGALGRSFLASDSDFGNTASDRMLERLPVRIGPNCEPVA